MARTPGRATPLLLVPLPGFTGDSAVALHRP